MIESTTELICKLLSKTPKVRHDELIIAAQRALLDYLGCLTNAQNITTVKQLRENHTILNVTCRNSIK